MKIEMKNKWPVTENGVDIYLYMDHSFINGEPLSGTQFIFGKPINMSSQGAVEQYRSWVRSAYADTVSALVRKLNLKDNLLAVTILGSDQYVMTGLTNDRSMLDRCISSDEFVVSKDVDARIYINTNSISHYNPFEEIYNNAVDVKKLYPKRKSVGIVIAQSTECFFFSSADKDKILKSVEMCGREGIEIITIGVKDAEYKKLISADEAKMLSTNKRLSTVSNYDGMLKHLSKVTEKIGGYRDYWWDATHTDDKFYKILYLEQAALGKQENALCLNELGKRYYFGVCNDYDIDQHKYVLRMFDYEKDLERAEHYLEQAARKGISESKLFLGRILQEKSVEASSEGKTQDAAKKAEKALDWICEAAEDAYLPAFADIENWYRDESLKIKIDNRLKPYFDKLLNKEEYNDRELCFLGLCYTYGIVCKADGKLAHTYHKKAAEKGYADSSMLLKHRDLKIDFRQLDTRIMGISLNEIKGNRRLLYPEGQSGESSKELSIASFVIGIVGFFLGHGLIWIIAAAVGIALGIKGKKQGKKGFAIAGIILNGLFILGCILGVLSVLIQM